MDKEYAVYPFKYMNITQRHDEGNHGPHSIGVTNYSDKPWDEACLDAGRSYFEPMNDFLIEEVLGIDSITTNSVRLKSTNKLYTPFKAEPDYLYITLTHMNEDSLRQVSTGQILKKGTKILLEGTDGLATGNHFHITANFGKYYGLLQNNNGKWCYTYEKSLLPSEAFYLDFSYTTIVNSRGYAFLEIPKEKYIGKPVNRDKNNNQLEVKVKDLRIRANPSLNAKILGYINEGIYNYTDIQESDGYAWYYIGIGWIAYSVEWFNVYEKEELTPLPEEIEIPEEPLVEVDKDENIFKKIFRIIINLFKNIFKK